MIASGAPPALAWRLVPVMVVTAASLATASCGAGAMSQRCGFADACREGLTCVHGGPENVGTCEHVCEADGDCGEAQRCQLHPPPDALRGVCVSRSEVDLAELAEYVRAVVPLQCAAHDRCQRRVLSPIDADLFACHPHFRDHWVQIAHEQVRSGRHRLDAELARRVLTELQPETPCDEIEAGDHGIAMRWLDALVPVSDPDPPAPRTVDACRSTRDCAASLACLYGLCTVPRARGESCSEPGVLGECASGLVCTENGCGDGRDIGEPCSSERNLCALSLRCAYEISRCVAAARPGGACEHRGACLSGFACIDGTCRPMPVAGEACEPLVGCIEGICVTGGCVDPRRDVDRYR